MPPASPSPPAAPQPAGSEGGNVVTYADGVLQVLDARAMLAVLAHGMQVCTDPYQRARYLGLATVCDHWLCGSSDPAWPAPDVPTAAVERWGISVGRLAVLHGDEDFLGVLASYAGVTGLRRRDELAEMLWRPSASLLRAVDESPHPVGYLVATVQQRMAAQARIDPQAHLVALDDLRRDDELRHLVVTTPGINTDEYLAALRATGSAADLRLAHDLYRWLHGATQHELGEAAYRRMMRHLRGQRARAIGNRAREMFTRAAGDGVMAPSNWYYSTGTRLDSVAHRANAQLMR